MPVTFERVRLDSALRPTQLLRALRGLDGLFGLIGDWYDGRTVIGFEPAKRLPPDADPFAALGAAPALDRPSLGRPTGFGGGWVGALGYQLGRRIEQLPLPPPRPVPLPEASLGYYDHVLVHESGAWWFEALVDDANRTRVEDARDRVTRMTQASAGDAQPFRSDDFVATPDAAGHRLAVATVLRHLAAGDIFQANVCRRFEAGFSGDPLDAFCLGVERLAPAYAAFLRTPAGAVASLSPELFLRRKDQRVRTSPIKGTAPLDADVELLMESAKERAENVMIVDLMRNDLGRVCVPGSVRVEAIARPEQRTGVWHLVSDVVGTLAPGADDGTLLRASFPPGSVTGAPKVRAMEVINEVETTGRETYTGAIGYASPSAGLELNVAIRTFEFADGKVWFGAGGGVVIDSTQEGELVETLVKARPLVDAIGGRISPLDDCLVPQPRPRPHLEHRPQRAAIPPSPSTVDPAQGVFTTCLVVDGRVIDREAHVGRLTASVAACYGADLPDDLLDRIDAETDGLSGRHRLRVAVRPAESGRVELSVTTAVIERFVAGPLQLAPGVVPGGLGPYKYVDRRRLGENPGRQPWRPVLRDVLIVDRDGSMLETGRGNLFLVLDSSVQTPALDGRLLPGVTRQRAIDELTTAGIEVRERRLHVADLEDAVEVFATGSVDRVRPVSAIETIGSWPVGRTTDWLAGRLHPGAAPEALPRRAHCHPPGRCRACC